MRWEGARQCRPLDTICQRSTRRTSTVQSACSDDAVIVGGASVGHPVLSRWTPKWLMQHNCIHPTLGAGFDAVMDALWAKYFVRYYGGA